MRKFEAVTRFEKEAIIPTRATSLSAGYDFSIVEDYTIMPNEIVLVKTGVKVAMPKGETLLVFPRSSLGIKKGLMMSNGVGVIDSDYYNNSNNEGHIMIPLLNFTKKEVKLEKGERVAQGIFIEYKRVDGEELLDVERSGGFGSTK